MPDKIKLLTISDHPLIASGVAIQTRYILEGLLETGDYTIRSIGAAMSHQSYQPIRIDPYGNDWIIFPVNGYGDQDLIRQALDSDTYDAIYFMTDPRFYYHLFGMADEIKERGVSLLYNHVWDEFPTPKFNKPYYQACDYIGCISKLTHQVVKNLGLGDRAEYIPHAVDYNVFKPFDGPTSKLQQLKTATLGKEHAHKFVFFYNSRNAVRKRTSDILAAFKKLVETVGSNKVYLFMHTNPQDEEGANLHAVCQAYGLTVDDVGFSSKGQTPEVIAQYNQISDVLINISSNEGFGISCLEALACGKLAIVNMTGGLQDQIQDENGKQFGVGIEPASKSLQGSQTIPYIFDCRTNLDDVTDAMLKLYKMSPSERLALGKEAAAWARRGFSMESMISKWDHAIKNEIEKKKFWDTTIQVVNL